MTLAARMCRVLETSRNIHDGDLGGYLAAEALAHVRDALTRAAMAKAIKDHEFEHCRHGREVYTTCCRLCAIDAVLALLDAAGT